MSWNIVIYTALLTVSIFIPGQTSGKEIPMGIVGNAINEMIINIPDSDTPQTIVQISDTIPDSQADDAHIRHVRDVNKGEGGKFDKKLMPKDDKNKKEMRKEDMPMEIISRIFGALKIYQKMNLTEIELVKRFWCRINVTKLSDIDENIILEASNLMDKDVKTCPLEKEFVLVEPIAKMLTKAEIPTVKEIIVMINTTLYQLLSPEDIEKMKNTTEGKIIFLAISQIFGALKIYQKMNLTEIELVKRFWCRINVTKLSDIDENIILEASNLMDKDVKTCPLEKEFVLVEPIAKMLTKAEIPTVKEIIVMINTTLHQLLSPEDIEKMKNSKEGKIFFLAMEKMKSHFDKNPDHTISQILGGLLCTIEKVDINKLSSKTFMDIIDSIGNTKCSMQQQRAILDKFMKMLSIRRWLDPVNIFGFFDSDLFQTLTKIFEIQGEELNTFTMIVSTVKEIKIIDWTIMDFGERILCHLDQTNVSMIDEKVLAALLPRLLKKPECSQDVLKKKWLELMTSVGSEIKGLLLPQVAVVAKEINKLPGEIMSALKMVDWTQIKTEILKIVGALDTLIETILGNIQKNPDQLLSMNYVLQFMACHVNTSEITKLDLDKLMSIASKFGQPVTCTKSTNMVWLEGSLKVLMEFLTNAGFQQLNELNKYIASFTSKDLKQIASEVKRLKDLAITSLKKVDKTSEEWISYIKTKDTIDIAAIVRQMICFFSKGKFSSIDEAITTMGELGQCTDSESKKRTEDFLNALNKMDESELMKEFLIGLGILSGEFNVKLMQDFITKITGKLEEYVAKFWSIIPKEIKELTIAKVFKMISDALKPLDELYLCVVKSIAFPVFGQPNAPDFMGCFHKFASGGHIQKPAVKPGKKPGGKLEDRYKVGEDFPFREESMGDMEVVLKKLIDFTREPNSEKEARILHSATNNVIRYLLKNPKKLDAALSTNKKRILELASKVKQGTKIMYRMKMDSESLSMVKKVATPQQAKKLLKKALSDMKMETKTESEKKDFIKKLPDEVMMKSGTQLIDSFFSEATKDVFIQSFRRKEKPKTSEEENEDDEEEEQQSLAKLSLVNKLFDKSTDNDTLSSMMNSTLVSVISVNMLKKLPQKEMCSMKAETSELKEDQVQFLVNSCPKAIENLAKTKASSLGKVATKVTKPIVKSLNLEQLISLTSQACKYERKLDIDLEKVFKDHYITEKLNPMKNAISMFCVLKYVETELPWQKPEAIEICKTLGSSIMKNIPPKRAEFFKSKCMDLLKGDNITFADMGSMNAFLKKADIEKLKPETILQGAIILAKYVWDAEVFSEIGKKLSDLKSFQKRSNLTTDQVAQAGIFIAAWTDADTIPKTTVMKTFDSIATSARQLQRKKLKCLKNGKDNSKCNVMDNVLTKTVQILIKATTAASSRRKRSTKASCRCTNLVNLGVAAVQVPANQMSEMICDTDFDECMEGLSQITNWNEDHRKVFVEKAIKVWGEPAKWNSSDVGIASAVIPGLTTDQIKVLSLNSMDATFYLGKQNNWKTEALTETFLLFLKNLKDNVISGVTSFDLQALGNIVCGISTEYIKGIPNLSYINAASQIGSLEICSEEQLTAWANKALAVYGKNINDWELAEIASIGSVISGFSTLDLQKLSQKQIAAISVKTIPKILPKKLATLHPVQIGYLTTSQVQVVTSTQKEEMTSEQKDILNKKVLGSSITDEGKSGGSTINVSCYFKWSLLLLINGIFVSSGWFLN